MKKNSKFLLIGLAAIVLALFSAAAVCAEADEAASADDQVQAVIEQSSDLADEPQELDGVSVAEPTAIPSNFGLWWRGLRERISLALILDPVKKAEKSLLFAEERVKLADYIIQNSTDTGVQAKAQQMLEKANQYIQRIEERQGDLLNNVSDQTETLLSNLSLHYANRERVMEKLEDKLPADKLEQFQGLRQQIEARQQNILDILTGSAELPAEVKEKMEQIKNSIQAKLQNREEFRLEEKAILDKIKAGNQEAKDELEKLRQERMENMEQTREQFKAGAQEIIDKIKAGTPGAVEMLRQLNQVRQTEMTAVRENAKVEAGEIKTERRTNMQQNLNELKQIRQGNNSDSSDDEPETADAEE